MRRDITINALFYNLQTKQVEDFTGFGLHDLEMKVLRTPIAPHITFLDDPLRVLRVIRFACRFNLTFEPEVLDAAKDDNIKTAFINKISRERVGVEVEKMMGGEDAARAISVMNDVGFFPLVFAPPDLFYESVGNCEKRIDHDAMEAVKKCRVEGHYSVEVLKKFKVKTNDTNPEIVSYLAVQVSQILKQLLADKLPWVSITSKHDLKLIYLTAAISPFRHHLYIHKLKHLSVPKYIVTNSLKLSNNDSETIHSLLGFVDDISECIDSHDRVKMGMLIRKLGTRPLCSKWPFALLSSLSIQMTQNSSRNIIEKYNSFMERVEHLQLMQVYDLKPLLDGKEICTVLRVKPGPKIGVMLDQLMRWQLAHPTASRGDAEIWIKQELRQ